MENGEKHQAKRWQGIGALSSHWKQSFLSGVGWGWTDDSKIVLKVAE